MPGPIGSRAHATEALLRHMRTVRHTSFKYISQYAPYPSQTLQRMKHQGGQINLDVFLNWMIALRCDVIVLPKDAPQGPQMFKLTEFPDNDGNILEMPDEIPFFESHRKIERGEHPGLRKGQKIHRKKKAVRHKKRAQKHKKDQKIT